MPLGVVRLGECDLDRSSTSALRAGAPPPARPMRHPPGRRRRVAAVIGAARARSVASRWAPSGPTRGAGPDAPGHARVRRTRTARPRRTSSSSTSPPWCSSTTSSPAGAAHPSTRTRLVLGVHRDHHREHVGRERDRAGLDARLVGTHREGRLADQVQLRELGVQRLDGQRHADAVDEARGHRVDRLDQRGEPAAGSRASSGRRGRRRRPGRESLSSVLMTCSRRGRRRATTRSLARQRPRVGPMLPTGMPSAWETTA